MKRNDIFGDLEELSDVYELMNDGVYTVQCPKGHTGIVVLENLHFELLFGLGINAIGLVIIAKQ